MKKFLIPLVTLMLFVSQIYAQKQTVQSVKTEKKISDSNASYTKITVNRITNHISNNGFLGNDLNGGENGIYFDNDPKKSLIYAEGLVWGGKINDVVYVNGATYRTGLQPGKIVMVDSAGVSIPKADNPNQTKYRIYRIKKDWQNLPSGSEKTQLETDYNEWPVDQGAPTNDDGTPKFLGSETFFYVCNDMNVPGSVNLYGSQPIGIEMQVTMWASNQTGLENVIYRSIKLVNKSGKHIHDFHLGIFSDPDLIWAFNDRVGFDQRNGRSFVYTNPSNLGEESSDAGSDKFILLSYELMNVDKLSSSSLWTNGGNSDNNDPFLGSYDGTIQMYRSLHGVKTNGYSFQFNGENYWSVPFDGDPLTDYGFTDASFYPAGNDRRILPSVDFGDFEANESLTLSYSVSFTESENFKEAFYNYRTKERNHHYFGITGKNLFNTLAQYDSETSTVKFRIGDNDATDLKVILREETIPLFSGETIVYQLYDDGTHGDEIAGDHVWTNESSINPDLRNRYLNVDVSYGDVTYHVPYWVTDFDIYPAMSSQQIIVTDDNINHDQIINDGENINFKIQFQSLTDLNLVSSVIYFESNSSGLGSYSSVPNSQSLIAGTNMIPQSGNFKLATQLDLNFPESQIINTNMYAYMRTDNHVVLPLTINYNIQKIGLSINKILTKKITGNLDSGVFGARTYGHLTLNDDYRINVHADPKFDLYYGDSVKIGYDNYQISVKRLSTDKVLVESADFPDFYGYNQPVFDNILLTTGTASNVATVKLTKTSGINLTGISYGSFGFEGTGSPNSGFELGHRFHGSSIHDFTQNIPAKIEIRIHTSGGQKAYVYDRVGKSNPGTFTGYSVQPFEVWDVTDNENPRQLNAMIMENGYSAAKDNTWSPTDNLSDREYLMILNSNYDGETEDQSLQNHIDYTSKNPLGQYDGNLFDRLGGFWMIKENPNLPPYQEGDVITVEFIQPVADGDEFTFNSVELERVTAVGDESNKAYSFSVEQNLPNPFNPSTVIHYSVPASGNTFFTVYNILGQLVWTQTLSHSVSGNYSVTWNGKDLTGKSASSGVYFYSLQMNSNKITKKMMLVK